jgi:hypothetical protein
MFKLHFTRPQECRDGEGDEIYIRASIELLVEHTFYVANVVAAMQTSGWKFEQLNHKTVKGGE